MSAGGPGAARWRVELKLAEPAQAEAFEAALDSAAGATSLTEMNDGAWWQLAIYLESPPEPAELLARLSLAAASAGLVLPEFGVRPVPDTDWVRHVQANTPPVTAGRFFVHGAHVTGPAPEGMIGIRLDAGPAFGTGAHESTRGCLIALDRLAARLSPANVLDMGTGSGILAIAAALLWECPVLAVDNDPFAVSTTGDNAVKNGVAGRVRAVLSEGFDDPEIGRRAPYDLIVANILADPLIGMAAALARHMAPGGVAVLSGILEAQAETVASAYGRCGLSPLDHVAIEGWPTLILKRG